MNITVFTSNQPRHIALIEFLLEVADEVYAIQEVREDFLNRSEIMRNYFSKVAEAERKVFGNIKFASDNVTQLTLKHSDLNTLDLNILESALKSDIIIIFGSSYIKSPLIDILIEKNAINIHMGVSPFYRGSACNFWALCDGNPDLVGATIHKLSKGLDSGDILYHTFPPFGEVDGFLLGMLAVKSAHTSLVDFIKEGKLTKFLAGKQRKELEIRYARSEDFTDEVVAKYLSNLPSIEYINKKCRQRDMSNFLNPYIEEMQR